MAYPASPNDTVHHQSKEFWLQLASGSGPSPMRATHTDACPLCTHTNTSLDDDQAMGPVPGSQGLYAAGARSDQVSQKSRYDPMCAIIKQTEFLHVNNP